MSKVTLDAQMRSRLNGLNEPLELCDESGETIGHFVPAGVYEQMLYRIADAQCPYTADELARMRAQTGGRTLAEWRRATGQS
jgi:hypothetical protein